MIEDIVGPYGKYVLYFSYFLKDFIFRERGTEEERGRNINVWLPCVPPTGDMARNPGTYPDWEPNCRSFALQAGAQSTEPHQPGPVAITI